MLASFFGLFMKQSLAQRTRHSMKSNCRYSTTCCAIALSLLCASLSGWAQTAAPSRAATVIDSMPHAKQFDQAVISPDGSQVAYILGGELAIVSASGGPARQIAVEGKLEIRDVSWSRDSKQIAFIADLAGDVPAAQVFTATLDAGAPVKRAELKGYASAPSLSRMVQSSPCSSSKACRA